MVYIYIGKRKDNFYGRWRPSPRQEFEGGRFDAVTWNLQLIDKTF